MTELQTSPQVEVPCPTAQHFLSIGRAATSFPAPVEEAREQFAAFQAIHAHNVLEPDLLQSVLNLCEKSTFETMYASCGSRQKEAPQSTGRVVNMVFNRPSFLRWLEDVTGCGPLEKVEGMLAQSLAITGDELMWHDDYPERGRKLAFVLNLSTAPYTGGEFEYRHKNGQPIFSHQYTELNSALIFAVDHHLEHRVLPTLSGGPRRVFAGWAFAIGGS